jgi:RNA polymerase sigma-70 factor (ECF subfamily)
LKNLDSLILECKNNNRKAQFELYKLFYSKLMRIARKYKKNKEDAASIVNDSFFKIFTNMDAYNAEHNFEAWIQRITINTIIDDYRKSKKEKNTIKLDDYTSTDFLEKEFKMDEVSESLEAKDILKMIAKLDNEEKMVFNLFEIDGLSHLEISKELQVSERTSKRYLANARANLKKMITKLFETVYSIVL